MKTPPPTESLESSSPTNHVFVDFENVQALEPAIIGNKAVRFTLLMGPKQTKLDVAIVEALLKHSTAVELVRLTSSGRNAVDFAVAYYLGRAAHADPGGYFHIVSKDTGFDPLVEHLRSRKLRARRHDSFETLTFGPPAKLGAAKTSAPPTKSPPAPQSSQKSAGLDERATLMLGHLRKQAANPPKRKTTLLKHVIAQLGNSLSEAEASDIVVALERAGHLAINDKHQVSYWLDEK